MSNHVFDIFNSAGKTPVVNISKSVRKNITHDNYQTLKPIEQNPIRLKSGGALSVRKPLADCKPISNTTKLTECKPKIELKNKSLFNKENDVPDKIEFKEIDDDFEDILPKHKRINSDDIVNILNCMITPGPRQPLKTMKRVPSEIEIDDEFDIDYSRVSPDLYVPDVFEDIYLDPPKSLDDDLFL